MATANGSFFKELHKLGRHINKMSTGQAAIEFDPDVEQQSFLLSITPNDGYYEGATCKFKIDIPVTYPQTAPKVSCLTSIYHPNIDYIDGASDDSERSVCVNLLDEDWQPGVGLDGAVMALLFLFHNPNFDDALNTAFSGDEMTEEEIRESVSASLRGKEVEGLYFDTLIDDEEETECNVTDKASESVPEASCKKETEDTNSVNDILEGNANENKKESTEENFSETMNNELEKFTDKIDTNHESQYVRNDDIEGKSVNTNINTAIEEIVTEATSQDKSANVNQDETHQENDNCENTKNNTSSDYLVLNAMDLPLLFSEGLTRRTGNSCQQSFHKIIKVLYGFGRLYRWVKRLWYRSGPSRQIYHINAEDNRVR